MGQVTKVCTRCETRKRVEKFPFKNKAAGKRHAICNACKAVDIREHYQRHRATYLAKASKNKETGIARNQALREAHLQDKCCAECGADTSMAKLVFVQPSGHRDVPIADLIRRPASVERLEAAMSKCTIMCEACAGRARQLG